MVHLLSLALYIVFIVFTRLGEEFKKTFNIFVQVHRLKGTFIQAALSNEESLNERGVISH